MSSEQVNIRSSSRAPRLSQRARDAQEQARALPGTLSATQLTEADDLIATMRQLELIAQAARPDKRSIAYAAAMLRHEVSGSRAERAEQAVQKFGLTKRSLQNVEDDWVTDDENRLAQAIAYRALAPGDRSCFVVDRLSDEERAQRHARKRQRLEDGARRTPPRPLLLPSECARPCPRMMRARLRTSLTRCADAPKKCDALGHQLVACAP